MKNLLQRILLPVMIVLLVVGLTASAQFQEIAAGVAIFLFGMMMLEDGFKLFSGGLLERILARATKSVPRSLMFGIVTTSLMQSSSLVTVITISFLSAGMITLLAGIAIIFGANIGTTTGAWLVAGFGLKVNISAYAMPLLVVGMTLTFQKSKYLRGAGMVMAGMGFLFLGIHYMKVGFDGFQNSFDLTRYAMTGMKGLLFYTLLGAVATVVMQSSHATMVLIITALASGQISYENALALSIGTNIGTTITAVLGALSANYQGKQLALAHVIFNFTTAIVALIFILPIRDLVDAISLWVGISDSDYALKLAVFHSLFNVLGVAMMLPLLRQLIRAIQKIIPEPATDQSQPHYLMDASNEFPETIESALQKEVHHLYKNAVEVITQGLNIRQSDLFAAQDIPALLATSRTPVDFNIDQQYDARIKNLYGAILEFSSAANSKTLPQDNTKRVQQLRDASTSIARAVKGVKHMRQNAVHYTSHPNGTATELYNGLRIEIASLLVEIDKLDRSDPETRSRLWLEEESVHLDRSFQKTGRKVEHLLRDGKINARVATSFLNDANYAYTAMRELIESAQLYYAERNPASAAVEEILSLQDDETTD